MSGSKFFEDMDFVLLVLLLEAAEAVVVEVVFSDEIDEETIEATIDLVVFDDEGLEQGN